MTTVLLTDFADPAELVRWRAVDDVVMGGSSRSRLVQLDASVARFAGSVSLENGGGFASVRTEPAHWPTAGAAALQLRCRGDGRAYKFTVRVDDGFDGLQYQARFLPPPGEWVTVTLPVTQFSATFRGRPVPGSGPLPPERIRRLGLMASDRQGGSFTLDIDWIGCVATT
ncbi:MAG: CIA30 family protein [Steroidobacteraceae bacterium]